MKKVSLLMFSFCMMGTLTASAQLGGLLGKKSAGKKSGSFATVWESEFDNKATRLALCDGDGQYGFDVGFHLRLLKKWVAARQKRRPATFG